jgi:hypothetical protein
MTSGLDVSEEATEGTPRRTVAISRNHRGTLQFAANSRSARSSAHAVSALQIATFMVPRVIASPRPSGLAVGERPFCRIEQRDKVAAIANVDIVSTTSGDRGEPFIYRAGERLAQRVGRQLKTTAPGWPPDGDFRVLGSGGRRDGHRECAQRPVVVVRRDVDGVSAAAGRAERLDRWQQLIDHRQRMGTEIPKAAACTAPKRRGVWAANGVDRPRPRDRGPIPGTELDR